MGELPPGTLEDGSAQELEDLVGPDRVGGGEVSVGVERVVGHKTVLSIC